MITSPEELTAVEAKQFIRDSVTHVGGYVNEAWGVQTVFSIYSYDSISGIAEMMEKHTTLRFAVATGGKVIGGGVITTRFES